MTIKTLQASLGEHGVKTYLHNGRVIALVEYYNATSEEIDVTDYSVNQLRDFLGYDDIPEYDLY